MFSDLFGVLISDFETKKVLVVVSRDGKPAIKSVGQQLFFG